MGDDDEAVDDDERQSLHKRHRRHFSSAHAPITSYIAYLIIIAKAKRRVVVEDWKKKLAKNEAEKKTTIDAFWHVPTHTRTLLYILTQRVIAAPPPTPSKFNHPPLSCDVMDTERTTFCWGEGLSVKSESTSRRLGYVTDILGVQGAVDGIQYVPAPVLPLSCTADFSYVYWRAYVLVYEDMVEIPSTFPVVRVDTIYHIEMDGWLCRSRK